MSLHELNEFNAFIEELLPKVVITDSFTKQRVTLDNANMYSLCNNVIKILTKALTI